MRKNMVAELLRNLAFGAHQRGNIHDDVRAIDV
jgi:hypothetical protein